MEAHDARTAGDTVFHDADLRKVWIGQTLSEFGSRITELAIPLTAILFLEASAAQMGYLAFVQRLPFVLLALWVGVWLDRRRRRGLIISADLFRALLLLLVPLAYILGVLDLWLLFVVGLLTACFTVVAELGMQSYLPSLVDERRLLAANSALEVSRSTAEVGGPMVAGLIIQVVVAPVALVIDAATFVFSAVFVALIRRREPEPPRPERRTSAIRDIRMGLSMVFGHPLLRAIAIASAVFNLFITGILAIYAVFLVRTLHLGPGAIGATFMAFGMGAVVVSLLAPRLLGGEALGRRLMVAAVACVAGVTILPSAPRDPVVAVVLLLVGMILYGSGVQAFQIGTLTVRQLVTPLSILGRVSAALRFVGWSAGPLGALAAGWAADAVGLRTALWIGAVGTWLSLLYLLSSPLARITKSSLPTHKIREPVYG
jgi:MFS family permease